MNMVASAMEDLKLDETEAAVLLNLILFNPGKKNNASLNVCLSLYF
jgi:hypothetical protein